LRSDIKIDNRFFKINIAYIFLIVISTSFLVIFKNIIQEYVGILIVMILYYFIAIIVVLKYVSKIIASVELKRIAKSSDYMGYFMLLLFSPIGIWIIQPKVRKYFV